MHAYECKKCGTKGTLVENVESINLNEIKQLPCGCPAENGIFQIFHFRSHKEQEETLTAYDDLVFFVFIFSELN
jgi:hypothetical protein